MLGFPDESKKKMRGVLLITDMCLLQFLFRRTKLSAMEKKKETRGREDIDE